MNIELKKVKVFDEMSDETMCFVADIWVDGKKRGQARNEGQGGSTLILPPSLNDEIEAYAQTLPKISFGDGSIDFSQDADSVISDLVIKHIATKELKKLLVKKIVFTRKSQFGIYAVINNEVNLSKVKKSQDVGVILNEMIFDEALRVYMMDNKNS